MKNGFLKINNDIFQTLLALSEKEQERGLMWEPFPPPIMSFIYPHAKINKFWMKNTCSPLDIVFCNNNKINQICKGNPFSAEVIGSDIPSNLVIELPYGTVEHCKIKTGQSAELFLPSIDELLKIVQPLTVR